MGILCVADSASCTHLASPRLLRTVKFICALAHAPVVLSTKFVDDCLSENKLLDPEDYLLEDTEGEKKMNFKLSDALARAQKNKGKLLRGYSIYCTEFVHGGFDTYKSIVETNGGKCLLYRARAGTGSMLRAGLDEDSDASESSQPEYVYLISGKTPEEGKLWPKFRQMVESMGKIPVVAANDWMLNMALSQEMHWHDDYALTEKYIETEPLQA